MDNSRRIFLVMIPEYPTLEVASEYQKAINLKYRLYKILPNLHITLESIYIDENTDLYPAIALIKEICKKTRPFFIFVDGFACFGPPYKSIHLNVIKTKPLTNLYQMIHSGLREKGYRVKEFPEGIKFHLTIASSCFGRDWSYREYKKACSELKQLPFESGFILKKLELWKPSLNPKERLLEIFNLSL